MLTVTHVKRGGGVMSIGMGRGFGFFFWFTGACPAARSEEF